MIIIYWFVIILIKCYNFYVIPLYYYVGKISKANKAIKKNKIMNPNFVNSFFFIEINEKSSKKKKKYKLVQTN